MTKPDKVYHPVWGLVGIIVRHSPETKRKLKMLAKRLEKIKA